MTPYRPLIEKTATDFGLDCNLVEAVVIAESNGCTDAFRFESGFYDLYLKDKPEYATLLPRRASSSYGLMQVMYPTAREYGFGELPELLFLPDVGLKFGCMHLRKMLRLCNGDVRYALASYNGGFGNRQKTTPLRYAARVLKLYDSVQLAHPKGAV
jgi:Soluble lytic murein transglycosylase and related regulatory proteins (some contain LysM/invasin domains)